ncbi:type IV pilus modification protein PilV [Acidovorax temperans]|uniref:type IV pilus modification protein PilV n=2 Tax=Acidovorax temperans TaxID=80878 RepID=UPI001A943D76|nr:type IV pilus modification protein PilV [Acidovorax temperans]MBO0944303.1 type IV pilus modification protein PilV [Acidovorax temperans]
MLSPHAPLRQRGFSLIESLVAVVVMALGILGILGVQMRTLADTQTGVRRAQAIRLIEDLSERIKLNPNALGSGVVTQLTTGLGAVSGPIPDCSAGCTAENFARSELSRWKTTVQNTLPLGDAVVFTVADETDANNRRQLGVMISWRENERNVDLAPVFTPDSTGAAGVACPANRICHLQYIQLTARCATYNLSGAATPLVFCPLARGEFT